MQVWNSLWARAHRPVDGSGLAAFRMLIGLLFAVSAIRFLVNGWVERFFVEPEVYFQFWGFGWVDVLPPWAMYGLFALIALLGVLVAVGAFYRVAAAMLFLAFTYVELIDVTNYLNHYYLLSLLSLLMVFLPLNGMASVDAWRRPKLRSATVPSWVRGLVMFQVGCVYVFAGLAKANSDWLWHAQPLNIWLSARTDLPVVGPYLSELWVAYACSWGGFLHDLLIVPFLLWRRTTWWAYGVLMVFHITVGLLFNIGLFPFIMIAAASVFLPPNWPRRLGERWFPACDAPRRTPEVPAWRGRARFASFALGAWCVLQLALPLRSHVYEGNVSWHEQGMRWSWRVMLREKNGAVSYRVKVGPTAAERRVLPSRYLTEHQAREMSGQPDLILQLAHIIRDDFRRKGHSGVQVRVDAWVSLNGRRARRIVDPDVDLARIEDTLQPARWILPGPAEAPPQLRPVRSLARRDHATSGATH